MSDRTSEMGTRAMLARFLSQEPITGTDEEIANTHEINRESIVKEILVHVFLMSKFRIIPGALTVAAATSQYLSATGNEQAAHCAPGQIMSGGTPIKDLITGSVDLRLVVENLFGNTDRAHLRFNMADSRAEENGLRDALCIACNDVARVGKFARFNRAYEFYRYIDSAYGMYKINGLQAFGDAITIQRAKMQAGEPLADTTRGELISILETYSNTLASSFNSLETVQGLFPEDIWRAYRAIV